MSRVLTGAANLDTMAAKMLGDVVIPASYASDDSFQSIATFLSALWTNTHGTLTLYQADPANPGHISILEADQTVIDKNQDYGGVIKTVTDVASGSKTVIFRWGISLMDGPVV